MNNWNLDLKIFIECLLHARHRYLCIFENKDIYNINLALRELMVMGKKIFLA